MSAQANHSALLVEHLTERRRGLVKMAIGQRGVCDVEAVYAGPRVTCHLYPGVEVYLLDDVPLIFFGQSSIEYDNGEVSAALPYQILYQ